MTRAPTHAPTCAPTSAPRIGAASGFVPLASHCHTRNPMERGHSQVMSAYENAFRKIKDATGVGDVNEVIQKFLTQEQTQDNLVTMTKEAQARIERLRTVTYVTYVAYVAYVTYVTYVAYVTYGTGAHRATGGGAPLYEDDGRRDEILRRRRPEQQVIDDTAVH